MSSIWIENINIPKHEKLDYDYETEAAVIGGGMAGILCAYLLSQKGVQTIVLEANRVGMGITKNTTAKITSQHNLFYDKLITNFGLEKAIQYAKANQLALEKYREIIESNDIDCELEEKSAYVYTLSDREKIEKEVSAANKSGINAEFTQDLDLPFEVLGAVKFPNQAQFHPLKFIEAISKDLKIFEDTMVRDIKDNIIYTDSGRVNAKKIIIATHYPFINAPGYYFLRMHQERSYVLGLENAAQIDGMYIDESDNGYSFRNYKDLLIFGGSGHKTGKNPEGGCYEKLKYAAKKFYPNSAVKYEWSAQDCVPLDEIPYIGRFSASTPDMYVATGFKKWGMTSSMVSAMIISDMITEKDNDYSKVFSPQRFNVPASAASLAKDTAQAVSGLFSTGFKIPEDYAENLKEGRGGIVEYEGHKVGVYKDDEGQIYAVSAKCAHLGCELSWNPDEKSWDCPCHGSRYDYMGNLIDNPATKGIKLE